MDATHLVTLAGKLAAAEITADQFLREAALFSAQTDSATVDLDRQRRCGFPEVIFGTGKTVDAICAIAAKLLDHGQNVLATRIDPEKAEGVARQLENVVYNACARTLRIDLGERGPLTGHVAIISAGTSDLPVAEETRETLDWMGVRTTMVHDVGVAGPHRLPARLEEFQHADAIVVVAGMEGALPSVVGGYVGCPVFAVPTSVGYGASLGGLAALLAMLNSCASNVAVVNIDAGFKAGYLAGLVATRRKHQTASEIE